MVDLFMLPYDEAQAYSTPTSRHLAAMRAERRRVARLERRWRLALRRYYRARAEAEAEFGALTIGRWRP